MQSSILKNASVLTLSNVLSPVASMVLVLTIGRLRGAEELGAYSLVMAVFVFIESLAALGLPVVVTREVAKRPAEASRQFAAGCAVGLGIVVGVLAFVIPGLLIWGQRTRVTLAMAILAVAVLPSVITAFGTAVLLALDHVTDFVSIDFVEKMGRAALGSALVFFGFGIIAIAWVMLLLRFLAAAAYVARLRRRGIAVTPRVDLRACGLLLRDVPVTGMIPILNAVYVRTDVFMLTWLTSLADVGYYGAALRLVDISRTFPAAFGRALYPQLSRLGGLLETKLPEVFRRATRHLLIVMAVAVLVLSGLADRIIILLYGQTFAPAVPCLRILAWAILPYALACTLSNVLFATGNQAADLRVNVICAVVCPVLHLALVPSFGIEGAAVATFVSMTLYGLLQYLFVRRLVVAPRMVGEIAQLTGIVFAAFLISWFLGGDHQLIGTVAGLSVYVVGIGSTALLSSTDRAEILRLIGAVHARFIVRRGA